MKTRKLLFWVLIFFSGILFYGFYNNIIIIRLPEKLKLNNIQKPNQKKLTNFFIWQNNKWHTEDAEIIWSDSLSETINNILVNWLIINYEFNKDFEKNFKQVSIQTVMLDSDKKYAYINFDKNPINKHWPIYKKIKFIESILKTLHENKIKIQGLYFLVNHKFLEDSHLDFSHAWPITGYTENI